MRYKAIKQLKSGKSGGPDRLLNEFFIHSTEILPRYLIQFLIYCCIRVIFLHHGHKDRTGTKSYF